MGSRKDVSLSQLHSPYFWQSSWLLLRTAFLPELIYGYQKYGGLFNLGLFCLKTQVFKTSIFGLHYADNCTLLVHAEENFQTTMDLFSEAYRTLILLLNFKKIKMLYHPSLGHKCDLPPQITIKTQKEFEHLSYLISYSSQSGH